MKVLAPAVDRARDSCTANNDSDQLFLETRTPRSAAKVCRDAMLHRPRTLCSFSPSSGVHLYSEIQLENVSEQKPDLLKPLRNNGEHIEAVVISSVSFVIWIYTIPGPFQALGLAVPYVGSLTILVWMFVVPYFYTGA